MRKHHLRYVLASIGVLVIVAAAFTVVRNGGEPIQVTNAEVTQGPVTRQIMVSGTLQPVRTVDIGSQVSGTIQSIEADFNSIVRAGQVVARLDPPTHEAQLTEATARLAQARAEHARLQAILDDARTKLARTEQLASTQLIPRVELDAARVSERDATAALKAAAAGIAAARAAVTQARVSLDHTIIRSPIDGIVINRRVDAGQTVSASVETPVLFTVADLRRMQLLAEIAEADVGGVDQGSRVTFQVESIGDRQFEGHVSSLRLQPILEPATASASAGSNATPAGTSGTTGAPTPATTQSSPTDAATRSAQPNSTPTSAPTAGSGSTASPQPGANAAPAGVVTYVAVIDVNNANGTLPPGGTAIVTLPGHARRDVLRVPNNALTFRPSAEAFAAVGQDPPILEPPQSRPEQARRGTRLAHVWKLEHRRFIPIAIEAGLSDDSWTEIVDGPLHPGDMLLTAAMPTRKD